MTKTFTAAALATLGALTFSSAALAGTGSVAFKDLDLTSDAGKSELNARIDKAARAVCTISRSTGTIISTSKPSRDCIANASKQIAAQIEARAKVGYGG